MFSAYIEVKREAYFLWQQTPKPPPERNFKKSQRCHKERLGLFKGIASTILTEENVSLGEHLSSKYQLTFELVPEVATRDQDQFRPLTHWQNHES